MNVERSEIVEFIRALSSAELASILDGDPLGASFLAAAIDVAELRWQAFDLFDARPAFYRAAVAHVAAVRTNQAAQLTLALEASA